MSSSDPPKYSVKRPFYRPHPEKLVLRPPFCFTWKQRDSDCRCIYRFTQQHYITPCLQTHQTPWFKSLILLKVNSREIPNITVSRKRTNTRGTKNDNSREQQWRTWDASATLVAFSVLRVKVMLFILYFMQFFLYECTCCTISIWSYLHCFALELSHHPFLDLWHQYHQWIVGSWSHCPETKSKSPHYIMFQ